MGDWLAPADDPSLMSVGDRFLEAISELSPDLVESGARLIVRLSSASWLLEWNLPRWAREGAPGRWPAKRTNAGRRRPGWWALKPWRQVLRCPALDWGCYWTCSGSLPASSGAPGRLGAAGRLRAPN